ncbi:MAG: hypothetical protein ACREDR_05685 [Blastocatellia bacterium]
MGYDERQPVTEASYRFLHRTTEERALLQVIMGILYASDKDPILRLVAADLVYTQALHAAENQAAEAAPATYDIKRVSLRLGLSPIQVRAAYEQLNESGGVHIIARQFPRRRERQPPQPLDGTSTDRQ